MRIPSTQALRALDSFARHGSVWRAADELNLTRSAVSHQLRLLERELGFELLERVGKGVALTARGRRYADDVRRALATLNDAGARHGGNRLGGSFSISCTPGFASLWLCPQIGDFQRMYPDVSLRVLTPGRLDDVSNPQADAFIAYGDGNFPNRVADLLCTCEFTPMCSPGLLNRIGRLSKPADVLRAPLLHLQDADDWSRWFTQTRVVNPDPEGGIFFSDMNLVISAAIAGQGFAMGDELTSSKALAEGRLIRPFDIAIKSPRSYYLVTTHQRADQPILVAFSAWVRERLAQLPGLDRG